MYRIVIVLMLRILSARQEVASNYVMLLAVSAGIAIALQVTVNAIGLRDLRIGGLIGVSGLATAALGFLVTLFA